MTMYNDKIDRSNASSAQLRHDLALLIHSLPHQEIMFTLEKLNNLELLKLSNLFLRRSDDI